MTGVHRHPPAQGVIRPAWLAASVETAVDPDLPIIDAHHHLWDPPHASYLAPDFLADMAGIDASGHDVRATVFIECHGLYRREGPESLRPVGETDHAARLGGERRALGGTRRTRLCAGIVGFVDFELGDGAGVVLDAHIDAGRGRFRGVRGRTSSHPDTAINRWGTPPGVLAAPATRQAIAQIQARGLSLDLWAYQTQVDEVLALCRAFPDLAIVIDHAGGPLGSGPYRGRRDEMFAPWLEGVRALADLPNVRMKISGLGMRFIGFEFEQRPAAPGSDALAEAWKPYVEGCLEAFGPDRCLFASNFPADKASCDYGVLWNAFKILTAGCSADERRALFHDVARDVYRLDGLAD